MGFIFIILILIFVFLFAVWMACGMLLIFTRPEGIRPQWWDWGMDRRVAKAKAEPFRVEEAPVEVAVEVVVEVPLVVAPEVVTEAARPLW